MAKQYWWVSVARATCEPAVVKDNRFVYTLGCADAFDVGDRNIVLVEKMEPAPLTPAAQKAAETKAEKAIPAWHGYRRF
jgi:hypothetical protein